MNFLHSFMNKLNNRLSKNASSKNLHKTNLDKPMNCHNAEFKSNLLGGINSQNYIKRDKHVNNLNNFSDLKLIENFTERNLIQNTHLPKINNNFSTNNNINENDNLNSKNHEKELLIITLDTDADLELKEDDLEECVICFQNSYCVEFPCGHKSCGKCRKKWKKISKSCPICRKIIF